MGWVLTAADLGTVSPWRGTMSLFHAEHLLLSSQIPPAWGNPSQNPQRDREWFRSVPKERQRKRGGRRTRCGGAREGGIVVNLTLTHSFPNTCSRQFGSGLSRVTFNHRNKAREERRVMRNLKDTDSPTGMWAAHLWVSQSSLYAELFLLGDSIHLCAG